MFSLIFLQISGPVTTRQPLWTGRPWYRGASRRTPNDSDFHSDRRENLTVAKLATKFRTMGSLQSLQEPITGVFPETPVSYIHLLALFLEIHFIGILPPRPMSSR
jgi:hypothetical protein